MAINSNTLICFDFEIGGLIVDICEVLELAAVAIDPVTLEINQTDKFQIYLKPKNWNNVSKGSLLINNLTKEIIEEHGVDLDVGWNKFINWTYKFNSEGEWYTRPIACGHNIFNFDLPIINRLAKYYGNVDEEGNNNLFHSRDKFDLMQFCSSWFMSSLYPKNYKLSTLRDYFGLTMEGSHTATTDVEQTARLIAMFLKIQKQTAKRIEWDQLFKLKVN